MVDNSACPRCHAPFTRLTSVMKLSDKINQYGRQEIIYEAQHENPVTYNKATDSYHCSDCGLDFSTKEYIFQVVYDAHNIVIRKKGVTQKTLEDCIV